MTTDLPRGWNVAKLGECCATVEKVDPRKYPDISFDYIDIGGIEPGSGRIGSTKRLRGSDAPSRARQLVRAGDVILSTVRTYQRKTAIVPESLDGAVASTGFCVLRPHQGINSRFILHQLLDTGFVERLTEKQTGTSYPAVRDRDVRAMSIRLAPEVEQRRIVTAIEEHFSRLNAIESTVERGLRAIAALRVSLLTDAFKVDRTLPRHWQRKEIGEVADVQLGRQRSPQHHAGPQMRPYLRAANVTWAGLSLDDVKQMNFDEGEFETYRLHPGDLLLNEASGSPNEVGKPGVWRGEIEDCCFQNTLLRLRAREVDPDYLYWYCYMAASTGRFGEAGRGVNIRHLGKQGLARFPIAVAPRAEQRDIVACLQEQFEQSQECETSVRLALDRARALRRSVLAMAFAGRLVCQSSGDESASDMLERMGASAR